jgi:signal transduction histidine kinase
VSLYRRHILSVVAVFLVVGGFFSWLSYEVTQSYIDEAKMQRVDLLGEVVTNGLKSIMLEGRPKEEFQRFLDGFAAEDIKAVRVFSDNGIVLSSTVPGEVGQKVDEQHMQAFKSRKGSSRLVYKSQGLKVYSSIMIMGNDWPCQRCHGAGDKIRAIVDLEVMHGKEESAVTGALARTIAAFLVSAGLLSLALVIITRRQIKQPLEKIIRELNRIVEGDSTVQVTASGADELAAIAVGVNRITSELLKAREAVQRYESAETSQLEKMASIGEVAATVAHEIKNPLAGISGALQVMAEDIPEGSPRKEICNEILSEIDRLDRCVKELIIFARPQEINPVSADLNSIVARAVAGVKMAAAALGIGMTELPGTLPETCVDPDQMQKVLTGVLLYQMQRMSDGGTITVSTMYDHEKGEIRIISADTARALTDENIRNIFKPSFSTKHTGSGLGLAVSRNIVESHCGRIRVESEPGIGNFFHIIIPGKR